jgi:hypothetical protein
MGAVMPLLAAGGLLAAYLPGRRAARVDPLDALPSSEAGQNHTLVREMNHSPRMPASLPALSSVLAMRFQDCRERVRSG